MPAELLAGVRRPSLPLPPSRRPRPPSAPAALALLAALLESHALDPDQLCLEDGVRPSDRQQRLVSGRNVTIGYCGSYWTSQELAARVQVIMVREVLGVHADEVVDDSLDSGPQYWGIAGCQDALDWSCSDYRPSDPIFHWTPEYWPSEQLAHRKMLEGEVGDALVDHAVVDAGTLGYVAQASIFIMLPTVLRAKEVSNQGLSLNWWVDLSKEAAMQFFTPLSRMDISWGFYQFCDHTEADLLRSMGYECNETFEYDNPWRQAVDGEWSEDGEWPKALFPVKDCGAMARDHADVVALYAAEGFECRGAGWWISAPCAAKSPGSEYRHVCIPVLSYDVYYAIADYQGLARVPVAMAVISEWDALEEFFYDWTSGHRVRGGEATVALFEWWHPDASIYLNYGSDDVGDAGGLEYTRVNFLRRDATRPISVGTLVSAELVKYAAGVFELLKNFRLAGGDIDSLMHSSFAHSGNMSLREAKDHAACLWVRTQRSTWEEWVGKCMRNNYFDNLTMHCRRCPEGHTSPARSVGFVACSPCRSGQFYSAVEDACVPCGPGYYSDEPGLRECKLCPLGRFVQGTGNTGCRGCPDSFVTRGSGSRVITQCLCPAGTFYDPSHGARRFDNSTGEGGRCVDCTEVSSRGLYCPGGYPHPVRNLTRFQLLDTSPKVQAGYMSLPEKPLHVYTCVNGLRCVGLRSPFGGDAMCDRNYALLPRCAACSDGFWEDSSGSCVECDFASFSEVCRVLLAIFLSILGTWYLYVRFNRPGPPGVIIMAQLLTLIQSLQTFGRLLKDWPWPLVLVFRGVDLVTLDELDDIMNMRTGCFTGYSPVMLFLEAALMPNSVLLHFLIIGSLSRVFRGVWLDRDCVINILGLLSTKLFISLCGLTLKTFLVRTMPSGIVMVKSFPTVEFGSGEWQQLLPIGIMAFVVYCLGTLAVVVHAVYRAPAWAATWPRFLVRYRFCFGTTRPERWWWVLVSLTRSLLMNVVQAIAWDPANQLYLSIFTIAGFLSLEVKFLPYKFRSPNSTDIALGGALLVVLIFSTAFAAAASHTVDLSDSAKHATTQTYSFIATSVLVACTAFALGHVCLWFWNLRQRPGLAAGKAARIALRFHDVSALQSHLSTRELFQAISRMNEMDLQILHRATNVMATAMLKKQTSSWWFRQRLLPGIPKEIWQPHEISREVIQGSASRSYVASDEENAKGRLRLVDFAARVFASQEEQAPGRWGRLVSEKTACDLAAYMDRTSSRGAGAVAGLGAGQVSGARAALERALGRQRTVSFEEFRANLRRLFRDDECSPEAAREIFDLIDVAGSGSISQHDFVAVMMVMAPAGLVRAVSGMSASSSEIDGEEGVVESSGHAQRPGEQQGSSDPIFQQGPSDPGAGDPGDRRGGSGEDRDCDLAAEGTAAEPRATRR